MSDDAPYTDVQVQHILRNWHEFLDTCQEDPADYAFDVRQHDCSFAECESAFVPLTRDLTTQQLQQAHDYIDVLAARFPFQLRRSFAMSRYHKFLSKWQDTGSFVKAMRAI